MTTQLQELFVQFKQAKKSSCWDFVESINDINDRIILPWNSYNGTMLDIVSYDGDTELVKKCISLGADINLYDAHGYTSLYWSFYNNHYDIAELLLKAGANPNTIIHDNRILYELFFQDDISGVELLVHYGALINDFHEHKLFLKHKTTMYFKRVFAKRRWVTIKCLTLILGIHKRAVVTANHPDRLKLQGVFEIEI